MIALVGLAIACAAAVADGSAGAAARGIHPAAVKGTQGALSAAQAGTTSGPAGIPALIDAPSSLAAAASSAAFTPDFAPVSALAASGIPSTALQAYQQAAAREAARNPGCGLTWPLLAGIGRVESNHGRFAGAVLHSDGVSTPRIIGIPLNGHGTALIRDTDHGRLDGDTVYDNAVGPMQFIPSTWASWGVDANGDGVADPFNIFDAAAAAADYLCAAGHNLTTSQGQVQAILSYNYSYSYVSMVMGLERIYAGQVGITVPVLPTTPEPLHGRPAHHPPLPPVDPGTPRGVIASGGTPPSPPSRPGASAGSSSSAGTSAGSSSSSAAAPSSHSSSGSSSSSSSSASQPAPSSSTTSGSSSGTPTPTPTCPSPTPPTGSASPSAPPTDSPSPTNSASQCPTPSSPPSGSSGGADSGAPGTGSTGDPGSSG